MSANREISATSQYSKVKLTRPPQKSSYFCKKLGISPPRKLNWRKNQREYDIIYQLLLVTFTSPARGSQSCDFSVFAAILGTWIWIIMLLHDIIKTVNCFRNHFSSFSYYNRDTHVESIYGKTITDTII